MEAPKVAVKIPTFMKDVTQISPIMNSKLSSKILQKVSYMTGWKSTGFPGSVPVPMSKKNMKLLAEEEYFVGSKLDGTRYLLLIDGFQKVYFINRNGEVFHTSGVQFPECTSSNNMENMKYFTNTLLDGEMIFRKLKNEESKPMFSIFDVICINGEIIRDQEFLKRMGNAKVIIRERNEAINLKMIAPENEPFTVDASDFYYAKEAGKVLKLQIPYETDGMVFVPAKRAYNHWPTIPGVNDHALKWKPGALNTVDFQLRIEKDKSGQRLGNLYVSELEVPLSRIDVTPQLTDLDGKIIECSRQNGKWVLLRVRWDREMPNSYITTRATLESIDDAISEDELINFIENNAFKK